jgi:hypothetical protein
MFTCAKILKLFIDIYSIFRHIEESNIAISTLQKYRYIGLSIFRYIATAYNQVRKSSFKQNGSCMIETTQYPKTSRYYAPRRLSAVC